MSDLNVKLNSLYVGAVYLSMTLRSRCCVNIINLKSTMPWIEALHLLLVLHTHNLSIQRSLGFIIVTPYTGQVL